MENVSPHIQAVAERLTRDNVARELRVVARWEQGRASAPSPPREGEHRGYGDGGRAPLGGCPSRGCPTNPKWRRVTEVEELRDHFGISMLARVGGTGRGRVPAGVAGFRFPRDVRELVSILVGDHGVAVTLVGAGGRAAWRYQPAQRCRRHLALALPLAPAPGGGFRLPYLRVGELAAGSGSRPVPDGAPFDPLRAADAGLCTKSELQRLCAAVGLDAGAARKADLADALARHVLGAAEETDLV